MNMILVCVRLMEHLAVVISHEVTSLIELCVNTLQLTLSIGFWEGKQFVGMPIQCEGMFRLRRATLIWLHDS